MLDTILNINIESLKIFLYSMFPITELRLSIPYFILIEEIYWEKVFLFSVLGNIFIGISVRYIISPLMFFLRKNKYFSKPIDYIINRTYSSSNKINKYKSIGLILFIGIPLPFTGVWTGSLAAYLLSISRTRSVIGIILGVLISGIIVTLISLTGFTIKDILVS
ncbi:MAG: hypothetical protein CMG66_01410 [Candidatus Marinimicrobia bacterium]|nr:hypothetical protein [Candidatus Neomarinimicrobiota bacterium]